jgi:hypothetical protein
VILSVAPFIYHRELGLAVRYLDSWCFVLWNKNKLPLAKVASFVRFNGSNAWATASTCHMKERRYIIYISMN